MHETLSIVLSSSYSSGVRWSQVKRLNQLKPLKVATSEGLEKAYNDFVAKVQTNQELDPSVTIDVAGNRSVEVDFRRMMMLKPDFCELRRAFEPGVYLQYKTSPSQMQVHLKVFRIQVRSPPWYLSTNAPFLLYLLEHTMESFLFVENLN